MIDKKAEAQWNKSCISYTNYQNYLYNKDNGETRFKLTFIDLLYISNFKGGNATINESEAEIDRKLLYYSDFLKRLHTEFELLKLADLNNFQVEKLIALVLDTCRLAVKGNHAKIDGFSTSYLSALLNAYFPKLIPILDRRVLINLHLVNDNDLDSQAQIKNIINFYSPLIKKTQEISKKTGNDVRQIDKTYFTKCIIRSLSTALLSTEDQTR
jgi:hypothetical protein